MVSYSTKKERSLQILYSVILIGVVFITIFYAIFGLIRDLEFERLYLQCIANAGENSEICSIYRESLGLDGIIFLFLLDSFLLLFISWQYSKRTRILALNEIKLEKSLKKRLKSGEKGGRKNRLKSRGKKHKGKSEGVNESKSLEKAAAVDKKHNDFSSVLFNPALKKIFFLEITYLFIVFMCIFLIIHYTIAPDYKGLPHYLTAITLSISVVSVIIFGVLFRKWTKILGNLWKKSLKNVDEDLLQDIEDVGSFKKFKKRSRKIDKFDKKTKSLREKGKKGDAYRPKNVKSIKK